MVLFKDLVKESSDLLTRDFPHEKPWDVEVKYKGGSSQFINCASASPVGSVDATTTMKYSSKDINTEIKVTPYGGAMLDVTSSVSKYVEGLTLGTRLERKSNSKSTTPSDTLDISCEYDQGRIHTRTQFNPLAATFVSSGCVSCNAPDNIRVGGEVSGGVDMSALKYSAGASYTQLLPSNSKWSMGVRMTGDMERGIDKLLYNVHTCSSPAGLKPRLGPTEMAMEMKHSLTDGKTGLAFGGLWYLDDQKNTSIKAKIGQDANLAMAVSHVFSPAVTGVLGVQVDTMKMSTADSVKYGIKLYCKTSSD